MDIRKVKKLIELLEESGIAEIEIKEGEESVRISRGVTAPTQYVSAPAPVAPAFPQPRWLRMKVWMREITFGPNSSSSFLRGTGARTADSS